MVMQEQEKEYAETVVSSNTCECQYCTQINAGSTPSDCYFGVSIFLEL